MVWAYCDGRQQDVDYLLQQATGTVLLGMSMRHAQIEEAERQRRLKA